MTTTAPLLACTVRQCGEALSRSGRSYTCPRGHAFDVARSGYLNLLQPHDRRSLDAGDARSAVEARARLLAAGIGASIVAAFVERAAARCAAGSVVCELGSGAGDTVATVARRCGARGVGIDLSVAAAELAARRFTDVTWVVANVDRGIPLLEGSTGLVLSLNARRHPAECARVMTPGAALLIGLPGPDDLIELRAHVQGRGAARERGDAIVREHEQWFALRDRFTARETRRLERDSLLDLLRASYRGERTSETSAVAALDVLDVTFATEMLLFERRAE